MHQALVFALAALPACVAPAPVATDAMSRSVLDKRWTPCALLAESRIPPIWNPPFGPKAAAVQLAWADYASSDQGRGSTLTFQAAVWVLEDESTSPPDNIDFLSAQGKTAASVPLSLCRSGFRGERGTYSIYATSVVRGSSRRYRKVFANNADLVLSFGDAAGHANRIPFAAGALSYLTTYPHAVDAKFLWRLSSNTDVVQVAWATRTDRSFGHFLNVAAWVHVPPGLDRSKIKVQALITPWIRNSDGSVSRQFGTASAMSFGSKSRDAGWELWVLSPCAGDDKKRAVILDFFVTAEFGDGIVHQARRAYPGGRTVPFRMLEGSQTVQYL